MTTVTIPTFAEFRSFLSEQLGVAESLLTPETNFLNDLAIESLKLLELVFQIEQQLGRRVPTEAAWDLQTVGDAYNLYVRVMRGEL
jgi:acyl carrier protein